MATVMVGVAGTVVIVRLVGAAGARSAGAAMGARPVTLRRSISRMDQGIGLERDDFLRIVITFGTSALYERSVDFVNTWGSAAMRVS